MNSKKNSILKYNEICSKLESYGYIKTEKTMGIIKANLITILFSIPTVAIIIYAYSEINDIDDFSNFLEQSNLVILAISFIFLSVVHELLHGLTWACFTPRGTKDIRFGFILKYLTPYASCKVPLKKSKYILGVLMPLIVLGIIPTIFGFFIASPIITTIGITFAVGAGGDVLMAIIILTYKHKGLDLLVYDHPTKMGVTIFEK